MRFTWGRENRRKVLGHGVSEKTAEAVAQVADFEPSKDGIAAVGVGELNGIRYKIIVMVTPTQPDEWYIWNCYRLKRGKGKR